MLTISLKGLRFYAFHGVYPEEKIIGNQFEIDLDIECIPVSGTITSISDTVNYTDLYLLIRTEMKKPTELLETFLMQTVEKNTSRSSFYCACGNDYYEISSPYAGL